MKYLGIIAMALLVNISLFAQSEKGKHQSEKGERKLNHLSEEFDLSESQKVELKKIFDDTRQQMMVLKNIDAQVEDKRAKAKAIREAAHGKIINVIGSQNAEKLEAMRSERKAHKGERGDRHKMMNPAKMAEHKSNKMKEELNLSDKQTADVKRILEVHGISNKSIREDASLSKEQKMKQIKADRKDLKKKLSKVLTKEQMAQMKEKREACKKSGDCKKGKAKQ